MHPSRRNFRAVWLSLFTTSMGLMAFLPVLALYVKEQFGIDDPGDVAFWASVIYGAGPLSAACMGPIWGAMGDRYGKKRMAVRANVAIALTTALMPFAPTPLWLLSMRVGQGVFAGYVAPAMAMVTAELPGYVHGRIIARLQVAMAMGSFVGPYIGAEVTGWFGRSALFWIASALSGWSALWLYLSAAEQAPSAGAREHSFFGGFWRGCVALLGNRVFAWLLVLLLVLRLGQNMLEPMLSLFVRELGPPAWLRSWSDTQELAIDRTIAVAFAVLAVAQWFCTPWWGRMADRHGPLRCLVAMSFGLCLMQLLMARVETIDHLLILRCVFACLMAGSMTLAYAAVSKRVGAGHRTLAFSLVQSCIQLGLGLGPILGAVVASSEQGTDFRRAFVVASLLCGVAGAGMFCLRRIERRTAN